MYHTTTSALSQLKQLCPNQSSIASCLNQLRQAKIQFLNLGNIIICPQSRSILIFKQRKLMEIETFQPNLNKFTLHQNRIKYNLFYCYSFR